MTGINGASTPMSVTPVELSSGTLPIANTSLSNQVEMLIAQRRGQLQEELVNYAYQRLSQQAPESAVIDSVLSTSKVMPEQHAIDIVNEAKARVLADSTTMSEWLARVSSDKVIDGEAIDQIKPVLERLSPRDNSGIQTLIKLASDPNMQVTDDAHRYIKVSLEKKGYVVVADENRPNYSKTATLFAREHISSVNSDQQIINDLATWTPTEGLARDAVVEARAEMREDLTIVREWANEVRGRGTLNNVEFKQIQPVLRRFPKMDNDAARMLIRLVADPNVEVMKGAKTLIVTHLEKLGYAPPNTHAQPWDYATIVNSNITAAKPLLVQLPAKTGRNEAGIVGVSESLPSVARHPAIRVRTYTPHGVARDNKDANAMLSLAGAHTATNFFLTDKGNLSADIPEMVQKGVRVISASHNMSHNEGQQFLSIAKAYPDVLFVVSAGDESLTHDPIAQKDSKNSGKAEFHNEPNIMVLAGAYPDGSLAMTSNYGADYATHAASPYRVSLPQINSVYKFVSGTANPAAMTSGVAAAMRKQDPSLTPQQIQKIFTDTGHKDANWSQRVKSGGVIEFDTAYMASALSGLMRFGLAPAKALANLPLTQDQSKPLLAALEEKLAAGVSPQEAVDSLKLSEAHKNDLAEMIGPLSLEQSLKVLGLKAEGKVIKAAELAEKLVQSPGLGTEQPAQNNTAGNRSPDLDIGRNSVVSDDPNTLSSQQSSPFPQAGDSVTRFGTSPFGSLGPNLNPNGIVGNNGSQAGQDGNGGRGNAPTAVAAPGEDNPFSNSIPEAGAILPQIPNVIVPGGWQMPAPGELLNGVFIPDTAPAPEGATSQSSAGEGPSISYTPNSEVGGVTIGGQLGSPGEAEKANTEMEQILGKGWRQGLRPDLPPTIIDSRIPGYGEGVPPADVGSNDTRWGLPDEPITLPESEGFPEKDPVLDNILNPNGVGRPQFTFPPIKEGSRIPEVPAEAQAALIKALPELQGIRYAQFSQLSAADQQQVIPRTLAYQQLAPNDKTNISLIEYLDSGKTSEPQRQQLSQLNAAQTVHQAQLNTLEARTGLDSSTLGLINARINAIQTNTAQLNQQTQAIQQSNAERISTLATQAQADPMSVAFIKPETTPESAPERSPAINTAIDQNAPIPRFMVIRTENGPQLIENLANGQNQLHAYPLPADTPITRQESNGAWSGVPDVGQIGSKLFLDLLFTNGALKMLNNGNPVQAPGGTPQQPPVNGTPQAPTAVPQPGF